MEVGVLGSLVVRDNDGVVALGGERQRLFLALLVGRGGQVVTADALMEALWPDEMPANPSAALHSMVARLRRALPEDGGVATVPSGYRLDLPRSAVDAFRFEDLLDQARAVTDGEDGAQFTVELLAEAIGLWRGRAYEEFADLELLQLEALRLEELRLVAEERYGQALVASDRTAEAVAHLERLTAEHPFREESVAALMRCLAGEGRQAEALRAYERHRRQLADELGLEPSPRLRRLDRRIAVGELSPGAPGSIVPDPDPSPTLEELIVTYTPSGRRPTVPLAVGRVGTGPRLVSVPAWVTSLDVIASSRDPRSALLERLAGRFEVVVYDQPGTGLSRGEVSDYSVEAGAADLTAVIENCGGEAVTVLAVSAGGPSALMLAARRPELVRRLVLFGTYGSGPSTFPDREVADALIQLVGARWSLGLEMLTQLYRPGASGEASRRLALVLRDSAPADVGARYYAAVYDADVSDLLDQVAQPTLVIHYRDDRIVPFAGGEHLATVLPQAQFVPLEGGYHLPDLADTARLAGLISRFVAET